MKAWIIVISLSLLTGCGTGQPTATRAQGAEKLGSASESKQSNKAFIKESSYMGEKIVKTESEWKAQLSEEQYRVAREKGTERAFTGKFNNHKGDGMYTCIGCGLELFDSKTKFDSGSGWPSYYQSINKQNVTEIEDNTLGMRRVEVVCGRCGTHLGHVFPDGPAPTGNRYCINSASLDFADRDSKKEK